MDILLSILAIVLWLVIIFILFKMTSTGKIRVKKKEPTIDITVESVELFRVREHCYYDTHSLHRYVTEERAKELVEELTKQNPPSKQFGLPRYDYKSESIPYSIWE